MKDRIKKIRKEANMTQEKFAEKLGLKRQTIATYETGRSEPMDNIIVSICREFNVNKEWLLTGKGETYKEIEDETAEVVSDLLEEDNPFYDLILGIMKTYKKLDDKSQTALRSLSQELLDNLKKRD